MWMNASIRLVGIFLTDIQLNKIWQIIWLSAVAWGSLVTLQPLSAVNTITNSRQLFFVTQSYPSWSFGASRRMESKVSPTTRHKLTRPSITRQPISWYSIYLPRRDGRVSWPRLPGNAPTGSQTRDLSITSQRPNHCTTKQRVSV